MFYVGIAAVAGLAVYIWMRWKKRGGDRVDRILWPALACGVSFFAALGLAALVFSNSYVANWSVREHYGLAALGASESLSGSLQGSFLYVSGSLDTQLKYTYYQVGVDGAVQAKQIAATNDNVYVYQDMPEGQGRLDILECTYTVPNDWIRRYVAQDYSCGSAYKFHIPKGTLVQQFSIQP